MSVAMVPEIPLSQITPSSNDEIITKTNKSRLSLNIKSVIFAITCSLLATIGALQFRIFSWASPMEVLSYSYISTLIFYLPAWLQLTRFDQESARELTNGKKYLFLIGEGLVTCLSLIFYNLALDRIPSSIVQLVRSLTPLTALILSRIALKEPLSILKIIAFSFIATGVVMIGCLDNASFDVSSYSNLIIGIIFATIAALASAMHYVLSKVLCNLNALTVCLSDALIGIALTVIVFALTEELVIPTCGTVAFVFFIFSLKQPLAELALFCSCKFGQAGLAASMVIGLNVVLAFIFDVAFFGLDPPVLQNIATILVLIGTGLNGFGQYIPGLPFLKKAL